MAGHEHAALRRALVAVEPLPAECWERIRGLARRRRYRKGDAFARVGETPGQLGFVVKGVFRAYITTAEGREYNKTFFTENTFMAALTSLLDGEPNRIGIQALEDAVVDLLDFREFTALYDLHQPLERAARRMIETEWVKKERREIALVLDDAAARYRRFRREHPGLEDRIPQYHIASYLGVTPIHLSRIRGRRGGGDS